MAKRKRRGLATLSSILGGLVLLVGFVWFVHAMMVSKISKPDRQVQVVQVILPPPPPPPPPEQPPPPPPTEKIEQPLPKDQPEPKPDDSPPPMQQLGLDAAGSAGSDAFGLAARQGGGDLIGSGNAPFAWYTGRISDAIREHLAAAPCTKSAKGSLKVHVFMEADGRVRQIKLATSTGSAKVDECIDSALTSVTHISDPAPPGMPEEVNLEIVARS